MPSSLNNIRRLSVSFLSRFPSTSAALAPLARFTALSAAILTALNHESFSIWPDVSKGLVQVATVLLAPALAVGLNVPQLTTTKKAQISGVAIAAIVPTKPGQIGVNPVDLPPEEDLKVTIGDKDSKFISQDGKSTKWVHSTDDFGSSTQTKTTVANKPTDVTVPIGIVVVAAGGAEAFDISLSESVAAPIIDIIESLPECKLARRHDVYLGGHGRTPGALARRQADCGATNFQTFAERVMADGTLEQQLGLLADELADAMGEAVDALTDAAQETIIFVAEGRYFSMVGDFVRNGMMTPRLAGIIYSIFQVGATLQANSHMDSFYKFHVKEAKKVKVQDGKDDEADDDDNRDHCPKEPLFYPRCDDGDCKGNDDEMCIADDWKSCTCIHTPMSFVEQFPEWYDVYEAWIDRWDFNNSDSNADGECSNDKVDFEKVDFKKVAKEFCNETDIHRPIMTGKSISVNDLNIGNRDFNYDVYIDWEMGKVVDNKFPDCSKDLTCEGVFEKLASDCSVNSHSLAKTAKIEFDCGTASYEFVPPKHTVQDRHCFPQEFESNCPLTAEPNETGEGIDGILYNRIRKPDKTAGPIPEFIAPGERGFVLDQKNGMCTVEKGGKKYKGPNSFVNKAAQRFSVHWVEGCKYEKEKQSTMEPYGPGKEIIKRSVIKGGKEKDMPAMEAFFLDILHGCDNNARGGWQQAGCLNYTWHPLAGGCGQDDLRCKNKDEFEKLPDIRTAR